MVKDRRVVWTDSEVEKLVDLWNSGFTASEVAEHLGNKTRNSVIGKINRMREHGFKFMPECMREYKPGRTLGLFRKWAPTVARPEDTEEFFNPETFQERPK